MGWGVLFVVMVVLVVFVGCKVVVLLVLIIKFEKIFVVRLIFVNNVFGFKFFVVCVFCSLGENVKSVVDSVKVVVIVLVLFVFVVGVRFFLYFII